jgi:hypothetical protein
MSDWTDLTLPSGAIAIYVSSSGSNSNPGTIGSPVQTISYGYSLLRDGHPDQLLLKRGDTFTENITWTKSSGSTSSYMVLGAYGSGVRPKLRPADDDICISGGNAGTIRTGFAIVDLDIAPGVTPTQYSYGGLNFFEYWKHLLIEGCKISGFPANIVIQSFVDGNRIDDVKIRRNVICDSECNSAAHSQGLFMGGIDNWVVEENVFDNNAAAKQDIFSHNVYIHESNGPGEFIRNISSRACSHGVQQRPGGNMENNLFLQNPINAYQGKADESYGGTPAATNYFQYNVALDSRDINAAENVKRGQAFQMGEADNLICRYNVAAHQETGTENVLAYDFASVNNGTISSNVSYDWHAPNNEGWATSFEWDNTDGVGTITVTDNQLYNPNNGMCVRHEGDAYNNTRFSYSNNRYWSTNPATGYQQFSISVGVGGDFAFWQSHATDAGSTFSNPGSFDVKIATYLASIGVTGTLTTFVTSARTLEKTNWDSSYLAETVNDWVRDAFGLPILGTGSEIDLSVSSNAASSTTATAIFKRLCSVNSNPNTSVIVAATVSNTNDVAIDASSSASFGIAVEHYLDSTSLASSNVIAVAGLQYQCSVSLVGISATIATMNLGSQVSMSLIADCLSAIVATLGIKTTRDKMVDILVYPVTHPSGCWKNYNKNHRIWIALGELAHRKVIIQESEVPTEPRVDDYPNLSSDCE